MCPTHILWGRGANKPYRRVPKKKSSTSFSRHIAEREKTFLPEIPGLSSPNPGIFGIKLCGISALFSPHLAPLANRFDC